MKLFKKLKKGFTLVELIVVIAVVAVLAATSIGVYFGVTESAKKSNDLSVITQMNKALKIDEAVNGAPNAPSGALDVLRNYGFDVTKMTPYQNGAYYLWDSKENQLVLLTKEHVVDAPADVEVRNTKRYEYYGFIKNNSERHQGEGYSYYLKDNFEANWNDTPVFSTSVDTGNNIINFKLDLTTETCNLNKVDNPSFDLFTKGGTLTINAPKANVNHYGSINTVKIEEVANESYHENGEVKMFLEVSKGRVVVEENAMIEELDVNTTNVDIDITSKAHVNTLVIKDNGARSGEKATVKIYNQANVKSMIANSEKFAEYKDIIQEVTKIGKVNDIAEAIAQNKKYLLLTNDLTITKSIDIPAGVTFDGNGYSITATADSSNTSNPRVINLIGKASENNFDTITIKNLEVINNAGSIYERGIALKTSKQNVNIYNCNITAKGYAITIPNTVNGSNINIEATVINGGWNAISSGASDVNISINSSNFEGHNPHENNAYAVVSLEAGVSNTKNACLTMVNTYVKCSEIANSTQYVVAFCEKPQSYGTRITASKIYVERCDFDYPKNHNWFSFRGSEGNELFHDGKTYTND